MKTIIETSFGMKVDVTDPLAPFRLLHETCRVALDCRREGCSPAAHFWKCTHLGVNNIAAAAHLPSTPAGTAAVMNSLIATMLGCITIAQVQTNYVNDATFVAHVKSLMARYIQPTPAPHAQPSRATH